MPELMTDLGQGALPGVNGVLTPDPPASVAGHLGPGEGVGALVAAFMPGTVDPAHGVVPAVRPGCRLDRARRPHARDVMRETAVAVGLCLRPVIMRRVDTTTGETEIVHLD